MSNFRRSSSRGMNLKYLKYAVGEIALVVIGILIALSINNWNERRKEREIEAEIIQEMLTSLESDRSIFNTLSRRLEVKDSAIQELLDLREKGEIISDEKAGSLMGAASSYIAYSYDNSPYEALVSLGIDKFENKELLNQIIYYYSVRLPRTETFINDALAYFLPPIEALDDQAFDEGIINKELQKNQEGRWELVWVNDAKKILNSSLVEKMLVKNLDLYESLDSRLSTLLADNKTLIGALNASGL